MESENIEEILICGLVTQGCIKFTCIGGLNQGFKTKLLENGHTNWNKGAEKIIRSTEIELKQKGVKIFTGKDY